jgi:uncharacterized protein (TIGR03083 family)
MTTTHAEFVDAHRGLFDHFVGLTERLSDEQMAVQSLCPDWDVRGVIRHVIGAEYWLLGWEPSDQAPPPFERFGEWEARVAGLGRSDFAAAVGEITAARLAELEAMAPEVVDRPSFTPAGTATYGRFLQVRVFDLWVHQRDIAIPLGEPTDDTGRMAEIALDEVDTSIGYIVGKRIGLDDGLGLTFRIRGGVDRDIHVRVDGRAARVDELEDPVAVVTADVGTFVMLAAGRVDPQEQIDAGAIGWEGDPGWGEKAARNLAYTR